jgi:outer membrane receptor for ferrienterochelin and colicin
MFYEINAFSGFVNYAFARRINEKILDSTITASDKKLTWAPHHTINFGVNYRNKAVNASVVGHFQGQVDRRSSDLGDATYTSLRGNAVDAWFSVDVRAAYQVTEYIDINGQIKNLLNQKNTLIKNMSYPFDYRGEQRQISIGMELKY